MITRTKKVSNVQHLLDGVLSADAAGRAKMADGFFTNAVVAKFANGLFAADATSRAKFADGFVNTAKLAKPAVTPAERKTKAEVALSDADATLTAAQLVDSGVFTITPSAARTLTTDTAANIVAAITGAQAGTWFLFTIECLAAFDVTLAAGTGVTLSGNAVVNNVAGVWIARVDNVGAGTEAVTIYRAA